MPYAIKSLGKGRFAAVKKATGKVVGRHASREKAEAQIAAIYANTGEKK